MSNYLLSIYQPSGTTPPDNLDEIMAGVAELNQEMQDAGVWVFAGGLDFPSTATVVTTSNGEPLLTDGPFVELKEYLGGLNIINVDDLDQALDWARKLAGTIGLPIEVRPFYDEHR